MSIITSADLAAYLKIDDDQDDLHLQLAAPAACQAVEEWCGRQFSKTAIVDASPRVFNSYGPWGVEVDEFWTTSGLIVKVDSDLSGTYESTWASTDYRLEPANGLRGGRAWPYDTILVNQYANMAGFPGGAYGPTIQVTAAWGWPEVPAAVKYATLIWGARLFKRKDSSEGVLGGFAEFGAVRVSSGDPDIHRATGLLAPFQRPRVA